MSNTIKYLLIASLIPVLSACATLDKDECRAADWHVIGYEDGSRGYLANRIGDHRKACAEHGVSPDFQAYNAGRAQGLTHYCIPYRGYRLGVSGHRYNGVCAGYNEPLFLVAYQHGLELFRARKRLQYLRNELQRQHQHHIHLKKSLKEKEDLLISGKLSKADARQTLKETRDITIEMGTVQENIHDLEHQVEQQSHHVTHIKNQHHY